MYAVVGCRECGALWVVSGSPETTGCPRCGTRHRFEKLHRFAVTADADAARDARTALLVERQSAADAADLDGFAAMGARLDDAGPSDAEYLAGSGVDVDEVAAAGDRASAGATAGPGRRRVVLGGLESLDRPTVDDLVAYATGRGVPEGYVRASLDRLVEDGRVAESGGRYRLV